MKQAAPDAPPRKNDSHWGSSWPGKQKLGDQTAWGKLISEGQVIITAQGYVGVRAMPPRGGNEDLSVQTP